MKAHILWNAYFTVKKIAPDTKWKVSDINLEDGETTLYLCAKNLLIFLIFITLNWVSTGSQCSVNLYINREETKIYIYIYEEKQYTKQHKNTKYIK